ncbi:hypothetical protein GCM10010191_53180 [Actinomadura vinacea]|uniref:Tetratricopeptide repeat protein n=1 Tax=Actinomadura vinacea TaxID=115336 RepID=A0ABN3JMG6_9ACTN
MAQQDERILCVSFGIDGWHDWDTLDRIRARAALAGALWSAGRGLAAQGDGDVLHSGDRLVFVLRTDPALLLPALVGHLVRHRPRVRGRLRMAAAAAMAGGATAEQALADSARMLAAAPGTDWAHPDPLVVLLSDLLYHETRSRTPAAAFPSFQRLESPGRPDTWIWPLRRARSSAPRRTAAVVLRWLLWCADVRIKRGEHGRAVALLRRALAVHPLPAALLKLGECHLELGETAAALEVWRHLARRWPRNAYTYLLIGRTERRAELARAYLSEGLRIARAHHVPSPMIEALNHELLLHLALLAYGQDDPVTGDRFVNEAADADPGSAKPLAVLAREAGRRGEEEAAEQLRAAALARVASRPECSNQDGVSDDPLNVPDGNAILESLLHSGLSPLARRQAMAAWPTL